VIGDRLAARGTDLVDDQFGRIFAVAAAVRVATEEFAHRKEYTELWTGEDDGSEAG
jgi:hypothetical protein